MKDTVSPPSYADCVGHITSEQQVKSTCITSTTTRIALLALLLILTKAALFVAFGYLMLIGQEPFKQTPPDTLAAYKSSCAISSCLVVTAVAWMGVVKRLGVVMGLYCVVVILVDSYLVVHTAGDGMILYSLLVPNVGALYLYTRTAKD